MLEPRRLYTEPSSRLMTPASTTTRCSGTHVSNRVPVESMILPVVLSTGTSGSVGLDRLCCALDDL
ncbi:hypothetical protein PF003_g7883 [Phytophthora fragariae]|nr:hypothetical protein PF003_g7883 [Phytophthora fragariae]